MFLVLIWLVCAVVSSSIADSRGLSGGAYFVIGLLLGPLGVIIALFAKPDQKAVEQKRLATGAERKCPYCAELIKREAVKCRYCGSEVEPAPAPKPDPGVFNESTTPRPPVPRKTQEELARENRRTWIFFGVVFGVLFAAYGGYFLYLYLAY